MEVTELHGTSTTLQWPMGGTGRLGRERRERQKDFDLVGQGRSLETMDWRGRLCVITAR